MQCTLSKIYHFKSTYFCTFKHLLKMKYGSSLFRYIHKNNKTSRAYQMTTGPGHSNVDPQALIQCVHPLDIQYPHYSISLHRVLHRVAVSTIFKVFGMTQSRVDQNPRPSTLRANTLPLPWPTQSVRYTHIHLYIFVCIKSNKNKDKKLSIRT